MNLESGKRLNIQLRLDFSSAPTRSPVSTGALEVHVLLATSLVRAFSPRFRLGLSCLLHLSVSECLTSLADDMA